MIDFDFHSRMAGLLALSLLAMVGCGDDQPEAMSEELPGGAVTQWTDSTELFMEHPALIVGAPDKFAIHLTDLTDFAPLRSGRVTLRFEPHGGGPPLTVVQDTPRAPGIYGPAPEFRQPGQYDLVMLVESPQARDSLRVPGLTVFADSQAARAGAIAEADKVGIPFLKEQQWKTPAFHTVFAREGAIGEAFETTGEVIPAAGRFASVSAPIAGLIDAGSLAGSPAPGMHVRRGQSLATLIPSLGDGGSMFADARARLREAEDEFARAERLYAAEAVPERRVHEARNRLTAAREALAGLSGGASVQGGRLAVRAPLSGVVTSRTVAPGSRVEAGVALFTIVDPSVVWLRADVPGASAERVSSAAVAEFRTEGSTTARRTDRLVSIGSVVDSASRTIPVIYEVRNSTGEVKVGAVARIAVRTGRRTRGVIIPETAVLDEDGRPVAYVQADGERFERRPLEMGGSEGGMVLVRSGIRDGERVVDGAAYQVRLASLSTSVPAHGHEH